MTRIPGVARRLLLARLALYWEALWPNLWPVLGVAGVFAALVLFDLLPLLPGWAHALVLLANAAALVWAVWSGMRAFRPPHAGDAQRRLERDSGIAHRPLTALGDIPSGDVSDPGTAALWQIHLARAFATVKNLRVRLPRPGLARRDPHAVRLAIAIAVIVGGVLAGGDAERRLERAVSPDLHGFAATQPATLELWVTPPDYTDLPPRLLASADQGAVDTAHAASAIEVPVGSRLLALVNHGSGVPQLQVDDTASDLEAAGDSAWRAEIALDEAGTRAVAVVQSGDTLGRWTFAVSADTAPEIAFAEPPAGSRRNALHIAYQVRDDYGIVAVQAELFGPSGLGTIGASPEVIHLPPPLGDPRDGGASSYHDLTAHPWAGLDVSIQLVATDSPGQEGRSDRLSVKLPERTFNHPVAREIIAQRRALVLAASQRLAIAHALHNIAAQPERYGDDIAVYLALMSARSRLVHNSHEGALESVLPLLWEAALRVEDGTLSLAEQDLRAAQERLREAIDNKADSEEIARLMEELRRALDRFLDALAKNLREQLQDLDITKLPQIDPGIEMIDRDQLQQMLNQLEDLARSGDRDAAQQMLSQLQQMLENLQNQPMARAQQQPSQAQEMMRALRDIVRSQQELYDQTFRRQQQDVEDPEQAAAAENAQNAVRRRLGELMRLLGERTGRIPQNLGNAERAMRDAEDSLGRGREQNALTSQGQALEELRQGANNMAAQLFRQQGPGRGPQAQPGYMPLPGMETQDPLGRRYDPERNVGLTPDAGRRSPRSTFSAERALQIQQELRQRLRDPGRLPDELDYIDRLLRRF